MSMKYITDLLLCANIEELSTKGLGIIGRYDDKFTENSVLVSIKDDVIYITFRGTHNFKNVLGDLAEFPLYKKEDFRYHLGFTVCYNSLRDELFPILKTLNSTRKVIISGHSLGAAMANICAIDMINLGYDVVELNLLACPKWGNRRAIKYIKKHIPVINHFLNANDAIYFVAPWLKRGKFIRIGKPSWYLLFSVRDHFLTNALGRIGYVDNLKKYYGDKF